MDSLQLDDDLELADDIEVAGVGSRRIQIAVAAVGSMIVLALLGSLVLGGDDEATESADVTVTDDVFVAPVETETPVGIDGRSMLGLFGAAESVGASSKPAAADPCTLFVATDGADGNDGLSAATPLASPSAAVDRAVPGDVVCFAPGTYSSSDQGQGAINLVDKHGAEGKPIVFRSAERMNPARLTMGGADRGAGVSVVFINRSSYITIDGFEITEGFRGVTVNGSSQVRILNSRIHHTGGELVAVGRRAGRVSPDIDNNPSSSHVEIVGNEIAYSGQAGGDPFGEGVYIATSEPRYRDDTNHVLVADNHIHHVVDEAVDVKAGAYAVTIENNRIEAVNVRSQAAVTVSIGGVSWQDGQFRVAGNVISGVTTRGYDGMGIWVGHGNATVVDNVIWDVAGPGIFVPNTFTVPGATSVSLADNMVWDSGGPSIKLGDDFGGVASSPPVADVAATNQTWDGASDTSKVETCTRCQLGG